MATEKKPVRDRRARKPAAAKAESAAETEKERERRMGDRRESPRLPIKVWVRNPAVGTFQERRGDISVGGLHFTDSLPIEGKQVDLRFKLPGKAHEVQVKGEVVRVAGKKGKYDAHVKFTDVDLETERAIARFIDERS
jgi:hypothetical protein